MHLLSCFMMPVLNAGAGLRRFHLMVCQLLYYADSHKAIKINQVIILIMIQLPFQIPTLFSYGKC